jgi:hypothetical protein
MADTPFPAESAPEILPVYNPDSTLIDRVLSRIGGEEQFADHPTARLLDSSVQINREIIADLSRLELALDRLTGAPSQETVCGFGGA